MHFLKEGQKIRAWVDPPPLFGQCPKENVFFIDVFPISETYVGAQREVPRSEGAPVLTVEVTLWVTQNLGPR